MFLDWREDRIVAYVSLGVDKLFTNINIFPVDDGDKQFSLS